MRAILLIQRGQLRGSVKADLMVNVRYTPRHSSGAVREARQQEPAVAPERQEQQPRASRMQIAIISGTALALLAIVTIFALRATPTDIKTCTTGTAATGCTLSPPGSGTEPLTSIFSVRVLRGARYSFDGPSAVAAAGALWVTDQLGGSVTRVAQAGTGRAENLTSGYGFDGPNAVAIGNNRVWIANAPENSVTEVNEDTGRLVRVLSAGYGFS